MEESKMISYILALLLVVSPEAVVPQEFTCYSSTDCRGVTVSTPPQRGDCCSDGRGLSFTPSGSFECTNCFNEDDFVGEGSNFCLVFFNNLRVTPFLSQTKAMVRINNLEDTVQNVVIAYESEIDQTTIGPNSAIDYDFPIDIRLQEMGRQSKGVSIQSSNGARLSVTAIGDELSSSDTYTILPCVYLPGRYEFYAVSVPPVNIVSTVDDEEIEETPRGNSVFAVVATEDDTEVIITPTQTVYIATNLVVQAGTSMNFTLKRTETLFVSSEKDLTGSHVVSDKPVSVFSGHECGHMPADISYCDHMVEQIPPISTWGTEFYTMSYLSRELDMFKAISSQDNNNVRLVCSNATIIITDERSLPNAGSSIEFTVNANLSCRFTSHFPILLVQFSVGGNIDDNLLADPSMTIVPPVQQYRNSHMIHYFPGFRSSNFLNIILINSPDVSKTGTRLNGEMVESLWTDILCNETSEEVCAFALQMKISGLETVSLTHTNVNTLLMAIPYAVGYRTGRGSFSGMTQKPIAVDTVSFAEAKYSVTEGSEVVTITLQRTGSLMDDITVPFRAQAMPSASNPAIPDEDFSEVVRDVFFPIGSDSAVVEVPLGPDDDFPGEDKMFEVNLGATPGVFVSPLGHVNVTIVDPDPPLPVMNISFSETTVVVGEEEGCLELTLRKEGVGVGPVTVTVTAQPGTAQRTFDFVLDEVNVTFEASVIQQRVLLDIVNDDINENSELFSVTIEPVEGLYPLRVIDSLATVEITDSDIVVFSIETDANQVSESVGAVDVILEVKSGGFDRNVTARLTSESGTADDGNDFFLTERVFAITPSTTRLTVPVIIFDDPFLEDIEYFTVALNTPQGGRVPLYFVNISIIDNDCVNVSMTAPPIVSEGQGEFEVSVTVNSRGLDGIIRLGLSTIPVTAKAEDDFEVLTHFELEGVGVVHQIAIAVTDNDGFDVRERIFRMSLSLLESDFERVCFNDRVIDVIIIDDEEPPIEELDTECILMNGDRLSVSSEMDCCVSSNGSAFERSGFTVPCIVIGFENETYELLERSRNYQLRVGVLRGRLAQHVTLTVTTTPTTASRDDYSVFPSRVRLEEGGAAVVMVEIILEPESGDREREDFTLELREESGILPGNVFLRDSQIIILDRS